MCMHVHVCDDVCMHVYVQMYMHVLIVGDFNTLSPTEKTSRKEISRETLELIDIFQQIDLTNIY